MGEMAEHDAENTIEEFLKFGDIKTVKKEFYYSEELTDANHEDI